MNAVDDDEVMWGSATELCTLAELQQARATLHAYDDVLRTPLLNSISLRGSNAAAGGEQTVKVSLKLESLQTTGSFKIRGMRYKLHVSDVAQLQSAGVVTLSAGNAGRAVSYLAQQSGIDAKVFMPDTAPNDRKALVCGALSPPMLPFDAGMTL